MGFLSPHNALVPAFGLLLASGFGNNAYRAYAKNDAALMGLLLDLLPGVHVFCDVALLPVSLRGPRYI